MTIAETTTGDKGQGSWKSHIGRVLGDWVLIGILILSSSLCFGLGLLTARANAPKGPDNSLWIEQLPSTEHPGTGATTSAAVTAPKSSSKAATTALNPIPAQPAAVAAAVSPTAHNYVASKTGTKYYLPTCGTVSRIKEENRVYFATKADAEGAGYQPSTACKGL